MLIRLNIKPFLSFVVCAEVAMNLGVRWKCPAIWCCHSHQALLVSLQTIRIQPNWVFALKTRSIWIILRQTSSLSQCEYNECQFSLLWSLLEVMFAKECQTNSCPIKLEDLPGTLGNSKINQQNSGIPVEI